jgi:hypothetical protein
MAQPLQTKDDQWRGRRQNGARPIFDPGLAPLGSDEEAGGARPPAALRETGPRPPLPTSPVVGGRHDPRLTPRVWCGIGLVILAGLIVAGWFSIPH